jgi:hypothetical protein
MRENRLLSTSSLVLAQQPRLNCPEELLLQLSWILLSPRPFVTIPLRSCTNGAVCLRGADPLGGCDVLGLRTVIENDRLYREHVAIDRFPYHDGGDARGDLRHHGSDSMCAFARGRCQASEIDASLDRGFGSGRHGPFVL